MWCNANESQCFKGNSIVVKLTQKGNQNCFRLLFDENGFTQNHLMVIKVVEASCAESELMLTIKWTNDETKQYTSLACIPSTENARMQVNFWFAFFWFWKLDSQQE